MIQMAPIVYNNIKVVFRSVTIHYIPNINATNLATMELGDLHKNLNFYLSTHISMGPETKLNTLYTCTHIYGESK